MIRFCQHVGLMIARIALAAWVGAAVLFVVNGIRLVTTEVFDSIERDYIALIRFPPYYLTGAACMALALAGWTATRNLHGLGQRRWIVVLGLIVLAGATLIGDYVWIYSPLAEMITPPGSPRPESFHAFHQASEIVNTIQVGLCLSATVLAAWPLGRE